MPGLDGTGPYGKGPMTGGGYGRCAEARCVHDLRHGHRPHKKRCADQSSTDIMDDPHDREEIESLKQHGKELEEKLDALAAAVEELKGKS